MAKKVAIIGSGISGLACSIRLAGRGFDVSVFEKNNVAGGKINQIKAEGYRFDTGPSLLTLPGLLYELFEMANENIDNYLEIKKLDNICRYFYDDGTIINAYSNPLDFANEITNKTLDGKDNFLHYLENAKELYNLTSKTFIFSPFQKIETFFTPEAKAIARNLNKLDAFYSLHKRNLKSFKDKKLVQLFDRYATYNGSNPYKAPATLKIISHLEHQIGAFIAKNGMYQIVKALYNLAVKKGVTFHFNSKVNEISYTNREIKGIYVNNEFIPYCKVICNVDITYAYKNLLKNRKAPWQFKTQEYSSSAIIFYWGIKKQFPQLDIHNIMFSANYKKEFEYLFNKKQLYTDPTVYIYISSKINNNDAPVNCENWFTMINAPHDVGQDWKEYVTLAKNYIVEKINKVLNIEILDLIDFEDIAYPKTIALATSSYKGALYGPSSNSKLSAFMRHANFKKNVKGLYFIGGSVHPGGGIPLCLASAKIVDQLIT